MAWIKKAFAWLSTHLKYVFLVLAIILVTIFVLWWGRRNKQIRGLENQLAILNARLKIEKLRLSYDVNLVELQKLRKDDAKVKDEIVAIEKSLTEKLQRDMTAEEIAAKFREIGILPEAP